MVQPSKIPKALLDLLLGKENVKIQDFDTLEQKILALISGGPNSLQVITDFDQTLTKFHDFGELCDSTFSVLTNSSLFSDEFKLESKLSCKKYGPIEINQEMTVEERIPYMLQWQNEFVQSLIKSKVNQSLIQNATAESNIPLRDNAQNVLAKLDEAKVPVLIFSAGIEDILIQILEQNGAVFPNLKIVSNKMEFNNDNFIIGFRPPVIHSFNKNKSFLANDNNDYFKDLSHRNNAILLGDNIGDIRMSDGMRNDESKDRTNILKIGFLEDRVEQQLDSYMKGYDIVILDDQSWNLLDTLLEYIIQN